MTERIIAKKEGAVGWLIFNNPGAPQRRLGRHVGGDSVDSFAI